MRQAGKGKLWKALLALERRKLKSININTMTDGNTAQLKKIHFHPQPRVKMKTSYHLTHICIIEPSEMPLVK